MHSNNSEPNIRRGATRSAFGARVGNRWSFAVEFDAIQNRPKTWNTWWGSLWLWVAGFIVGSPEKTEMLLIGLDSLHEVAAENRSRPSAIVSSLSAKASLDLVMNARYGTDSDSGNTLAVTDEELSALEVLPRRTGPFFDGWEAILLDEGDGERFIYRPEQEKAVEIVWPKDTFHKVVQQARSEFERLARSSFRTES